MIKNGYSKKLLFIFIILLFNKLYSQATYNSSNYAIIGDSFYLTKSSNLGLDYESTGANFNWNFSSLIGISQDKMIFRNSNATSFAWPWILNPNNANLSSTNSNSNTTINLNGITLGFTNINKYYKKTSTQLIEVASAFKLNYNGVQVPVTNQYTDSDIIYNFPLIYGNTDSDNSSNTTDIPNIYHQETQIARNNNIDGWGTLTTPFGTFSNVLRMKTNLVQTDNITILGNAIPTTIRTTRELKWFDPSQKYPVLIVEQTNTNGIWTTTSVQYLDSQKDFQTTALFAYTPIAPSAGQTVYFQNLSSNATDYLWDFGDPANISNSSTDENPTHVFNSDGTYLVKLKANNSTYNDELTIPIVIRILATNNENMV